MDLLFVYMRNFILQRAKIKTKIVLTRWLQNGTEEICSLIARIGWLLSQFEGSLYDYRFFM